LQELPKKQIESNNQSGRIVGHQPSKTHTQKNKISKDKKIKIKPISEDDGRLSVKVSIFNNEFNALLDSGSLVTVLGKNAVNLIKSWDLRVQPYQNIVTNANGKTLEVLGSVHLPLTLNGETKILNVIVLPALNRDLLLGIDFFEQFGIRIDFIESLDFQKDENTWDL
jgi:predicted aspartyl protease